MRVPLLDLKAQNASVEREVLRAIRRVLRSQRFILGPEVERFESRLARYCGTRFAVGLSSGTDALLAALMALEVGPGDEVVTSPYSFFATAGVVARLGARPVFADIDPKSFNLDPRKLPAALTRRTKAILPVHLYGRCAEMEPILKLAGSRRLPVVEDAAQAIGAEVPGDKRAGSLGTLGCFSFYPSKNLGAFGDAGAVTTNDPDLAERVRALRVHGARSRYYHREVGGNFRLDAIQAAVLNVKLGFLEAWTRRRRQNAGRYERLFRESGLVERGWVRPPEAVHASSRPARGHIYNQYVVRVEARDRLREHLKRRGIETEVYYPLPLHLQECFRGLGYRRGDFPVAEAAARETLALPIYAELRASQQAAVVGAIRNFYGPRRT